MRLVATVIGGLLVACEPAASGVEASGSGSDTTDDVCPGAPRCDLCPDPPDDLCGLRCPPGEPPCTDQQGAGMSCVDGRWQCDAAPPAHDDCDHTCTLDDACSEVGCDDGVTIRIVAPRFDSGVYELGFVHDGDPTTCTFTISDSLGCAAPPCVTDATCNAVYDLAGAPPQIVTTLPIARSLVVRLSHDGKPLLDADPDLVYGLSSPNGPGCSPVCATASVQIDLP